MRNLRSYSWKKARADAGAAINVAVLDFPQALAFATIAGLPLAMGLFASAIASITGPLFAASRHLLLGPTNAIAILTLSGFLSIGLGREEAVSAMPLLLLMVAGFLMVGAFLRVAAITQFVSRSVVTGYITVAALTIVANQLRPALGLAPERNTAPFALVSSIVRDLGTIHFPSVILVLLTIGLYFALKRWLPRLPAVALSLLGATLLNQLHAVGGLGIATLLDAGLSIDGWRPTFPAWDVDLLNRLVPVAMAIAFLSLLESASIAKTLAARSGEGVDLNQQTLSLGVANLACAFGGAMPISGSLTRSRLNQASGARTPLASLFSGLVLVGAIFLVGPYAAAIPKPALAAVIVLVGVSLINRANIRLMLGATRSDAVVFLATFTAGLLLPLTTAIFLGTALSITLFLRKAAAPALEQYAFTEEGREVQTTSNAPSPAISLLHIEGDLFFGSSDIFLDQARRLCTDPSIRLVIVRLRNAHNLDATCAAAFDELIRFGRERERHVLVSGARPEVYAVFRDSGLLRTLGKENFFLDTPENPTLSTSLALRRARELMGGRSAEIRLFVPAKPRAASTD